MTSGNGRSAPFPNGRARPEDQAAEWARRDETDQLARDLLAADARLAKDYLAAAASLAKGYLAGPPAPTGHAAAKQLATAETVAAELLATAEQAACELLATAKQVAADRLAAVHRFESMFRDHDAIMLLIDPATGQIVDANPAAAEFYGYTMAELISMPITQINMLFADEVADRLAEARSGRRRPFSSLHRLASGEIRRVNVSSSPIHDGRPLLFSIITDVEDRMMAEQALARQAERLELVLSATRLGLWDWNMVTGETVFDQRWAQIVGYDLEELQPVSIDTWVRFCHPDDLARSNELIEQHISGVVPFYDIQVRMKHRDGHWVWVHDRGKIVEWTEEGRPLRMAGTHEDITHEREMAMKLAAAEEESRLAFDRSMVATCLVSNEGRITRANPALCQLLGRSERVLLTLDLLDVTHPDDISMGAELVAELLAGHRPSLRLTKRYLTGAGRVIWGDVTVSAVLDDEGAVRHRIAQIVDATGEHALRESLLEAERIAHVGGWQLDVASGGVSWSPELFDMFGLDPTGQAPDFHSQQHLFAPESWERLTVAIAETQVTGAPYELELETVRSDGTRRWVQARGEAIRDTNGTIVELHGVCLDITGRKIAEEALAASEELLQVVLDTSSDAILRIGRDGRVEYVNQQIVDISGASFEEWIGSTQAELGYPTALVQLWDAHRSRVFATGEPVTFEFQIDNSAGSRWYETKMTAEVARDGSVGHVIETSRDITDRKQGEATLRASRWQLQQAQRLAQIGSWTLDLATNHVVWSEELYRMHGLDPQSPPLAYTELSRLFTPASWHDLSPALAATQTSGLPYEMELELVRPDGSHGWILARGEAVRDSTDAIVELQGVAIDITERKTAADDLQVLATRDSLTGLANRATCLNETSRAITAGHRSGRATALLMMDLDHFKDVNDALGHAAGDDLLVAAADRIQRVVRAGDLVARLGGDEFVVVMRDLDRGGEAVQVAERLVTAFRQGFTSRSGSDIQATASVGVAIASDSRDADDLVRQADTAMYTAKEQGRDRVAVFDQDLRAAISSRLTIENDLRHALDQGELEMWYQPEVDPATGTVIALEALLRWHHPDGRLWTADQFIDVAEEARLLRDIGSLALHQACGRAADWAADRPDRPLVLRVNLSAHELADNDLLPLLDDALTVSGLDPSQLCVEVTETTLTHLTSTARDNIDGVHVRGISIAIDNFGTGNASLTYLRNFPIDVLKIDRTLIAHLTTNEHDRQFVAGILALAAQVNISVTAKGVEHFDQAALLTELGCPATQGFHYSPALAGDLISPFLDRTETHAQRRRQT